MAVPVTQFQDCMIIAKAFEKGANFAMTQESVFAVLAPRLDAMRSMSKAVKRSMEDKAPGSKQVSLKDAANPAASTATVINGDLAAAGPAEPPQKDIGELIRECIPCSARINFKEKLDINSLLDPTGLINQFSSQVNKSLKEFFERALGEINQILDMFRNLDKYVDLCAFRKFLTEFVCVPDLQRIMALLSAFMMKISLGLNNAFGTVLTLFGPLLLPFLTGIVDMLMKFVMMAIKPIECVIQSLQRLMAKLDYNVLFQNVDQLQVSLGPKQGAPSRPVPIKLPAFGTIAETQDPAINFDERRRAVEFNLNPLAAAVQNAQRAKVAAAQKELEDLQKASLQVDASKPGELERHLKKTTEAKKKLHEAQTNRDLSVVGQARQKTTEQFNSMKGSLVSLINTLRRAAGEIEAYVRKAVDEISKLISEFMGGGANSALMLGDKLQLVQLMSLVAAIIKAIQTNSVCETEGQEVETFLNQMNLKGQFSIHTDDDGTVHINEKEGPINDALEDLMKAFGIVPAADKDVNDANRTRQKLKSLIQFTGDDTLDSGISRAFDALTTPMKVKFNCPLQTSVASAEQVNKWINELNTEV